MNPASNQQPPIALPTKDGLSLSYDYAKATHRILMTWETESFKKALGKAKEQRPRIDAFSGTLNGIFLDFDDLGLLDKVIPAAFCENWHDAERWLSLALGANGCVFRSASGKVKVFCPIRTSSINQAEAKTFAIRAFSSYFEALDSKGGFRYSFIDTNAYIILKRYLKSNDYELALANNTNLWNTEIKKEKEVGILYDKDTSKSFTWNIYTGQIPSSVLNLPKNDTLIKVFRAAAGAFYLSCSYGVVLPQHQLGELFQVSQPAISCAINRMIKLGIIRRTAYACHEAGLAARYRFEGEYLDWAKDELKKIRTNKTLKGHTKVIKVSKSSIESLFKEGTMNRALFIYTRFFDDMEGYLEACKAQPYFGSKREHEREARAAWASHKKRRGRKPSLGRMFRFAA